MWGVFFTFLMTFSVSERYCLGEDIQGNRHIRMTKDLAVSRQVSKHVKATIAHNMRYSKSSHWISSYSIKNVQHSDSERFLII